MIDWRRLRRPRRHIDRVWSSVNAGGSWRRWLLPRVRLVRLLPTLLPMAEKLAFYSRQEMLSREIIVRGILAIQSGEHPRLISQRLQVFLPPSQRALEV